jgi:hypothetical protein
MVGALRSAAASSGSWDGLMQLFEVNECEEADGANGHFIDVCLV